MKQPVSFFWQCLALPLLLSGVAMCPMSISRAEDPPAERTWTDDSGRFQMKATYESSDNVNVTLKKADGGLIKVAIARLSEADRSYLQSLVPMNPFVPAIQPPRAGTEAIVLVNIRGASGTEATVAGVVFHRDDKRAYVLTDQQRPVERTIRPPVAEATIVWDSPTGPRRVSGEVISLLGRLDSQTLPVADGSIPCIVAGKADEMPAPIDIDTSANFTEGAVVGISGFDIDTRTKSASFARVSATGTVSKVFRNTSGMPVQWELDGPELAKVRYGIAFLPSGKAAGELSIGGFPGQQQVILMGPARFSYVQQPRLLKVDLEPVSGDTKTIRYELLLSIFDPFNRLKSPQLLTTPTISRHGAFGIDRPARPAQPFPLEVAEGTEQDELVKKLGAERRISPAVKLLVAHYDAPNLGPNQHASFELLLSCSGPGGESVNLIQGQTPLVVGYSAPPAAMFGGLAAPQARTDAASRIPGLDGKPLDMPRPVKLDSGEWLITSDMTRVSEEPKAPSTPFPQPAAGKGSEVAGPPETTGPLTWRALHVPANPKGFGADGRPLMTYSPDGKWLYLIDGAQVLHKLHAQSLVEDRVLDTQATCNGMTWTKDGLVVAVQSLGALWVLDPDSLKVKYDVAVGDVTAVACSPATNIGFALVASPGEIPQMRYSQLLMVDLRERKALHVIKGAYGSRGGPSAAITVDDKPIFSNFPSPRGLAQTPDGKFVLVGTSRLVKFRIDNTDLVFTDATRDMNTAFGSPVVVGSDGKLVAISTGPNRGASASVVAFDIGDLSKLALSLSGVDISLLGMDAKTGNFYSPAFAGASGAEMFGGRSRSSSHTVINIFGPRGGKIASAECPDRLPKALCVNPQGEQFTLWCQSQIYSAAVGPVADSSKSPAGQ